MNVPIRDLAWQDALKEVLLLIEPLMQTEDCLVARARHTFEPLTIDNFQPSPRVFDESAMMQASGNGGHSRSLQGKHLRQKLLRKIQHRRSCSVLSHQQPSRQACLGPMHAAAAGNLFCRKCLLLQKFKNAPMKLVIGTEKPIQVCTVNAQRRT